MEKKISLFLRLVSISMLLFMLSACGNNEMRSSSEDSNYKQHTVGGEKPIKLSFAFFTNENTFIGQMVQHWADQIEMRTEGRVNMDIYFGGTLLDANNMYNGVRQKVADGGLSLLQYEPGKYPLVQLSELLSYQGSEVSSQVAYQLSQEFPVEALSDLKTVIVFSNDHNYLFTNSPVKSLADIKGEQYRVAGTYLHLIERFGAAGIGMSQAEQAEALQTRVIDGAVTERALTKDAQLVELVSHLVDKPLYTSTIVGVMNMDTWNSLPEDIQSIFEKVASELPLYAGKLLDERTQENLKWAQEEHGLEIVKLNETDNKKWDEIVKNYQEEQIEALEKQGMPARIYYERAKELIEQYSK